MKIRDLVVVSLLSLVAPAIAFGQERVSRISVHGAVGSLLNGGGIDQSLSFGLWASKRVGILISAERIHLPTEVQVYENGSSATRGGTATFLSGEIRWLPLTVDRVSPYLLAGAGRGISRPNVNDIFPDPVTNDTTLMFGGGGLHVPLTEHFSVFGDLRFVLQLERDSPYLFVPVRGGVAWRF